MALYSNLNPDTERTDASYAELFAEFKVDEQEELAENTTRGQIALYINAIQHAVHRPFQLYRASLSPRVLLAPESCGPGSSRFVNEPFTTQHLYLVGQATRCYSAYDPEQDCLAFLKDFWRNSQYEAEHSVYVKLHTAKVSSILRALAAGDVEGEEVQDSLQRIDLKDDGCQLIHYRLVLNVLGEPITNATSTFSFVKAISDALKAHKEAWYLTIPLPPTLSQQNHIHEIRDDLESFVHKRLYLLQQFNQDEDTATYSRESVLQFSFLMTTEPFKQLIDQMFVAADSLYAPETFIRKHVKYELMEELLSLDQPSRLNKFKLLKDPFVREQRLLCEISERQGRLLTHDWIMEVFERALKAEGWVEGDWQEQPIAEPHY
ncbi:hypothetical protein D9757_002546 [Collybiopsis confluens]|uniref:Uncharacterized protein n=1 Tax=Collybiopsis confluens TaxID=2823264 RepID=A0A8H5MEK9_9AGAR|nr:hypothetical protein D9757_002546 [Collybiopsis confluens]